MGRSARRFTCDGRGRPCGPSHRDRSRLRWAARVRGLVPQRPHSPASESRSPHAARRTGRCVLVAVDLQPRRILRAQPLGQLQRQQRHRSPSRRRQRRHRPRARAHRRRGQLPRRHGRLELDPPPVPSPPRGPRRDLDDAGVPSDLISRPLTPTTHSAEPRFPALQTGGLPDRRRTRAQSRSVSAAQTATASGEALGGAREGRMWAAEPFSSCPRSG